MIVRKCDRCGKTVTGKVPCFMYEVKPIIEFSHGANLKQEIDLCNDCMRDLAKWLNVNSPAALNAIRNEEIGDAT